MSGIFDRRRVVALFLLALAATAFGGCPSKPATPELPADSASAKPATIDEVPNASLDNTSEVVETTGEPSVPPVDNRAAAPLSDEATKKLVTWLREVGASIEQNEQDEILSLVLGFTEFGDADVAKIAGLPKLEFLGLDHTNITDKGVAQLAPLKSLKTLNLSSNSISGAGLAPIAKLTNLQSLDISELPIDDKALAPLAALKNLKQLNLSETKVTLEGTIAFAKALPNLEVTAPFGRLMGGTRLTMDPSVDDADLARLKSLPTLREINLWECDQITNAGIAHLTALPQLTSLELGFTQINNEGLESLATLKDLKQLDLRETNTSMAAALQLVAKLPALRVLAAWGEVKGAQEITLAPTAIDEQLAYLRHLPNLEKLSLWRCDKLTDAALAPLAKLKGLRELNLGATNVGDDGLAALEQLADLERLVLANTPITDKALAHIGKLTKLKSLDLSSTGVTDAGMQELAALQQLETLSLAATGVTNVGLSDVAKLKGLTALDLEETRVGEPLDDSDAAQEGLATLGRLPQLRRLLLSLTLVDDWAVAQLDRLPAIEELDLWGTAITDASVEPLARMKTLKQLGLVATQLSPAALAQLQQALPQTKIVTAISEPQQDD
jgi:Leucine-rich repeat (LRR) protein